MKKTSFLTIVLILLTLAGVGFFAMEAREKKNALVETQAMEKIAKTNTLAAESLQTKLSDAVSAMKAVAAGIATKESNLFSYETIVETHKALSEYGFLRVALCDEEGDAFEAMGSSFFVTDDKYFQRGFLGDTVVSYSPYQGETPSVVIHVPIFDNQTSQVLGVIRADLGTDIIRTTISTSEYRGRENVLLLNAAAETVVSLSGEFTDKSILTLWGRKHPSYQTVEQIIKQGREHIEAVTDADGNSYLVSYKGIRKVNDWGVATIINTEDLYPLLTDSFYNILDFWPLLVSFLALLGLCIILFYQAKKHYRLEYIANVDHITKSYNFKGFARRMAAAFEKDAVSKYAFLEVTLDRFEYFKETFGNDETNRTLVYMSKIISEFLHPDECYCRYNTMFFIILIKYENEDELKERILYLKSKITGSDNESIHEKFTYNLMVGAYCPVQIGMSVDEMIHFADTALVSAQANYSAPFVFYRASMDENKTEAKELEQDMYHALEEREFMVYLQPKFSLKDGTQRGAEALVRWRHPTKGLIFPGRFIPLFEKNGFIVEMDMYILDELCRRLQRWIRKGIRPLPLSINISMHNLYSEGFVERVREIIHKYGVPTNLIILEFSEEAIAGNIALTCEILNKLKDMGFFISMDDFGRSVTSMNTLYQTTVDEVKIDRKFLTDNEKTERGQSIINTVFETAKKLNIAVVGEGVTDKGQARLLQELGCEMMQGFVFAEPMPEQEYEEYAYGPRAADNRISV